MEQTNRSIKCSVQQCRYNAKKEGYCTLDCVDIGTHELNPTKSECVDCKSFSLE